MRVRIESRREYGGLARLDEKASRGAVGLQPMAAGREPAVKEVRTVREMKMKTSGTGMRMVVMGWLVMAAFCGVARAQQWTQPTAEELSMTSQAGAPGAPAVYLYREQTTQDRLRMFSVYERIKILSEGGKDYANVDLTYATGADTAGFSIDSIEGRTIHSDGTVIPFTGKPYDKLVVRRGGINGIKVMSKVFTLPSVEVGSILEYRYKLHYSDSYLVAPSWFVQTPLYIRKAHFVWEPTTDTVLSSDGAEQGKVAWASALPAGAKVVQSERPTSDRPGSLETPGHRLELTVDDVPGLVEEPDMPPISSLSYRVLFYYTSYASGAEFWKAQGKKWSKARDKFIGSGPGVKAFTEQTVGAGDAPEVKLKKIYAAVMTMENTRYTRERSHEEDRAAGLKAVNNTDDVLARKRGTDDQLAELFAAMVRAAGMKAYVMGVSDRSKRLFLENYLSLDQLDDLIVMVPLDGKQRVFDPGSRYCGFGELAWQHTDSGGLMQVEGGGAALSGTPDGRYQESHVARVADLELDEHGEANGTVKLTFTGSPALTWRQTALLGDDVRLNTALKESLERRLPGGMEVRVTKVTGLADGERPRVVE